MHPAFSLASGFHAVVIGGAGDIGAAIANLFCDLGAKVTATGVDEADIARTRLKARAGLKLAPLDVTDDAAVASFATGCDRVDALVNCAGILARDKEYQIETFMKVLDVNLTAGFRLARACLRTMMRRRWGRIIGIGSVVGHTGNPGQANYAAAKAGMVGMSKALAAEVASRNITVNVVSPGFIETAMTGALSDSIKLRLLT